MSIFRRKEEAVSVRYEHERDTDWSPIENSDHDPADWMWMRAETDAAGRVIHYYKHSATRRYISLPGR